MQIVMYYSIILSGLYFVCGAFASQVGKFVCVDLFNSQEGNSSLQKRGAEKYISGKRMQMQTKLFNKYVLVFFSVRICPFLLRSLSHISGRWFEQHYPRKSGRQVSPMQNI